MQQDNYNKRVKGMTLIEVLVALMISSFVFSSLLQMAFDSLKRAKTLELQDKMRNYATEMVQVIYNAKDTDWANSFGETAVIPAMPLNTDPASQPALVPHGFIKTIDDKSKPKLEMLRYETCHFDAIRGVLEGDDCESTAASEPTSVNGTPVATSPTLFGRIVIRTDDNFKNSYENQDNENDAQLEVVVACIENKCDGKKLLPFKLSFQIYRTSGP